MEKCQEAQIVFKVKERENGWMNFGQEKKKLKRNLGPG